MFSLVFVELRFVFLSILGPSHFVFYVADVQLEEEHENSLADDIVVEAIT